MNISKYKFLSLILVACAVFFLVYIYGEKTTEANIYSKTGTLEKFYLSYQNKDVQLYNSVVLDNLKVITESDLNIRGLLYSDLIKLNIIEMKEIKDSKVNTFDGIVYDKDNIAEFTVTYKVDFDKNIYGSAGEGVQSVRKILVRKDARSPWLVAGQIDGQGY